MSFGSQSLFIGGRWQEGAGDALESRNPALSFETVWSTRGASASQCDAAVEAARAALPAWSALDVAERAERMEAVGAVVERRADELAGVITAEMGKPIRESLAEAKSLLGKIRASRQAQDRLPDLALPGAPGECRWKPHGVMAVVGPFNYPIHLVHTHVAPALLAGNTVVIKSSEITPLSVRIYVEMLQEAGLGDGVVNLVTGGGAVGASLVRSRGVDAVAFTGSWGTGRRIVEACLDEPGKLLALEMGGKNVAVVLEDAHMDQALHEVLIGACLTAGQRCTATSRVIVQASVAERFFERLVHAMSRVTPGDPLDAATQMGPLATDTARERFLASIAQGEAAGARALLSPTRRAGGAFVTPGVHRIEAGTAADLLANTELFAPHLTVEVASTDAAALTRLQQSRYGLSTSVFTIDAERFERFTSGAPSGIFNWNRSTNNASGLLPFGGLGWSGNHRSAGSAAALYCAYPTAILRRKAGDYAVDPLFAPALAIPG